MTLFTFRALLAMSLAGNAALAWMIWGRPPPLSAEGEKAIAAVVSRVAKLPAGDAAEATVPGARPSVASAEDRALILEAAMRYGQMPAKGDPRALAAWMLREGYPDDVVSNVVSMHLDEWLGTTASQKAAKEGDAEARRVNMIYRGGGALQRYMRDMFPLWRETEDRKKAHERKLRFGDMPLEKVLAVERAETELHPPIRSAPLGAAFRESEARDAALYATLGQVLTPAELQDYKRFNSTIAKRLQVEMNKIEIDEATYDRLLTFATAHSAGTAPYHPPRAVEYRGVLSDAQIVQLVGSSGGNTGNVPLSRIFDSARLPDTQRVDLLVLIDRASSESDQTRRQQAAAAALAQTRAALAVAPESLAEFEKSQNGKALVRIAEGK